MHSSMEPSYTSGRYHCSCRYKDSTPSLVALRLQAGLLVHTYDEGGSSRLTPRWQGEHKCLLELLKINGHAVSRSGHKLPTEDTCFQLHHFQNLHGRGHESLSEHGDNIQ